MVPVSGEQLHEVLDPLTVAQRARRRAAYRGFRTFYRERFHSTVTLKQALNALVHNPELLEAFVRRAKKKSRATSSRPAYLKAAPYLSRLIEWKRTHPEV